MLFSGGPQHDPHSAVAGASVGASAVGLMVGGAVGAAVGATVGDAVGDAVGTGSILSEQVKSAYPGDSASVHAVTASPL